MESGQINVDELALKVKRAAELIKICKVKLHETEADVQKILKDLDATSNEDE
jgi:exodeoxyribonuclease VII small subunit